MPAEAGAGRGRRSPGGACAVQLDGSTTRAHCCSALGSAAVPALSPAQLEALGVLSPPKSPPSPAEGLRPPFPAARSRGALPPPAL